MLELKNCAAVLVVGIAVISSTGAGCSMHRKSSGSTNAKPMTVEVEPSPQVELPAPRATRDGNTLKVSGIVQRKSGYDGPVPGHLHVDVLSPDGAELVDQLVLNWTPLDIPAQSPRQSRYQVT
jgi:hypothetical protein